MTQKLPKTPWPAQVIREQVKQAMNKVGGEVGFQAIGPTFQEAIISQAAFRLFQSAAASSAISVSFQEMTMTVRAMRIVAGIEDEE